MSLKWMELVVGGRAYEDMVSFATCFLISSWVYIHKYINIFVLMMHSTQQPDYAELLWRWFWDHRWIDIIEICWSWQQRWKRILPHWYKPRVVLVYNDLGISAIANYFSSSSFGEKSHVTFPMHVFWSLEKNGYFRNRNDMFAFSSTSIVSYMSCVYINVAVMMMMSTLGLSGTTYLLTNKHTLCFIMRCCTNGYIRLRETADHAAAKKKKKRNK
jgi:hypothetical protein